jgi:hypothetical protein
VIAAVAISVGVYTISSLFTSNTINEPLSITAAVANQKKLRSDIKNLFP